MAKKKIITWREKVERKKRPRKRVNLHWESVDWEKAQKILQADRNNLIATLRKKTNQYPYTKDILKILAGGIFLSACLVMPGLPRVLKLLPKQKWDGDGYDEARLRQTLKRLKKQKEIEVVETRDGPIVKITEKGIVRALKYKLGEMKIKKPAKWDGKWRLIIFDIPHSRKKLRDLFREKLKELGFHSLQKSVFIYPYPCGDEIEFLRQVFEVGEDVIYIIADRFEGEREIRRYFNL